MKRLFILVAATIFLSACDGEDMKYEADAINEKREKAEASVLSNDFSTDNLLVAQDYFFSFAEQLELMKSGPELTKAIQSYAKSISAEKFCSTLLLKRNLWESLDRFCRIENFYGCSVEMENYIQMVQEFQALLGAEIQQKLQQEASCRF